MSEEEIAEQMHDNPLHWAEKYTKLQAESECGAFDHCGCKDKVAKLQAENAKLQAEVELQSDSADH